jgi:hypothetical protein
LAIEGLDLYETFCYVVSATGKQSVKNFADNLRKAANWLEADMIVVKEGADYQVLFEIALALRSAFADRTQYRKSLDAEEEEAFRLSYEHFPKILVWIENLQDFMERIYMSYDGQEDLYSIFELFFKQGEHRGILFFAYENSAEHYGVKARPAGKYFLSYQQGIHFGGRLDQQKLFDFSMPLSKQMKVLDYNIGSYLKDEMFYQIYMPIK